MKRTWRLLRDFLDDWNGEPDRPGVPGRRGVLERLERLDYQVHPNSGTSLRDQVDRTHDLLVSHIDDDTAHGRRGGGTVE